MGVSGCILKRKEDIDVNKSIEDIKMSAVRAGLLSEMNKKEYSKDSKIFRYVTFNIYDKEKKHEILLYLFNVTEQETSVDFNWMIHDSNLIHIINIEDFDSSEKLVLDFIYEYLFLNRKDIFWDEQEWFYDYDSIKEIKNRQFDNEWCYKPFM